MATEGAFVVVNARKRENEMNQTVEEIVKNGGKSIGVMADVSTEEGCKLLLETTLKHRKKVDVLVNNAGIGIYTTLNSIDEKVIERQISTNFKSVLYCSKVFSSAISDGGEILNVSSIAGVSPIVGLLVYGSMKAAVITLTRYLALEMAPRIRVNVLVPGFTKTKLGESMASLLNLTEEQFAKRVSLMGKILQPEDVAELAASIVKIESLTGGIFLMDSGESIKGSSIL
ncbi:3-ketoacyl-ACP reductase [Sulfolobales archaeon HS-7]|nr:3-ketoacyl-ACP reductase [Sulfolobales archaeon HS-7]